MGSHGGSMIKNPSASEGDVGSVLGSGRSPGKSNERATPPVFFPRKSHDQRNLTELQS